MVPSDAAAPENDSSKAREEKPSRRLEIPADVIFEVLDGEAVILNLKTGVYFSLNAVGTRIWKLIEEHGEIAKISETMLKEYEVQPEALDLDLQQVLSQLVEKGLVLQHEASTP